MIVVRTPLFRRYPSTLIYLYPADAAFTRPAIVPEQRVFPPKDEFKVTWAAGAQINHDIDLRLQYLAGMGVNNFSAGAIASEIARVRRFPLDIFSGSPESIGELQGSLVRF